MADQRERTKLLGVFGYMDDLLTALRAAKERNLAIDTIYSPTPRHEIWEALGLKPSVVRYFTLTGGILGVITGVGLVIYTSLQWKLIVSGKPIIPLVPSVVVGFEFCILLSILFNITGMLVSARLPKIRLPDHFDPRFTEDRFGVLLAFAGDEREAAEAILKEAGAEEIHDVQ